jgi:hypothetical protein
MRIALTLIVFVLLRTRNITPSIVVRCNDVTRYYGPRYTSVTAGGITRNQNDFYVRLLSRIT